MKNGFTQIASDASGHNFTGCVRCYLFGGGLRSLSYRGGTDGPWISPPLSKAQRVNIKDLLYENLRWCFAVGEDRFWINLHYVAGTMIQGFLETPSPGGPTTFFRFGKDGEVLRTHQGGKRVFKSKTAVDTFEMNLDSFPANAEMVNAVKGLL